MFGLNTAVRSRLNPFRSGQCLSTSGGYYVWFRSSVSIPFDQGNVFRHHVYSFTFIYYCCLNPFRSGQCLSTESVLLNGFPFQLSQSLSIRAMSFDCSGMLEAGIMRPFRPTSQFFWKVKELALDLSK